MGVACGPHAFMVLRISTMVSQGMRWTAGALGRRGVGRWGHWALIFVLLLTLLPRGVLRA